MANGRSNVTVLQVLPSLVTGGVERGTVEITAGDRRGRRGPRWWRAPADRMVAAVERAGGRHITLPLASQEPADDLAQRGAAGRA